MNMKCFSLIGLFAMVLMLCNDPYANVGVVLALENPDFYDIGTGELRFSFIVVTDIHNNSDRLEDFKNWANIYKDQYKIAFVVVLGDITHQADALRYPPSKSILDDLKVPYFPLVGNHDVADPWSGNVPSPSNVTEKAFHDSFISAIRNNLSRFQNGEIAVTPVYNPEAGKSSYFINYAFDVAVHQPTSERYHFVFLDFCCRKEGGKGSDWWLGNTDLHDFSGGTYRWLKDHLYHYLQSYPSMRDRDHIFLFSHHPPGISTFGTGDYNKIVGFLTDKYQDEIGGWFAGHTHRGEIYNVKKQWWTLCPAIVTDALGGWSSDHGHFRIVRVSTPRAGNGGHNGHNGHNGGYNGCPTLYVWNGTEFVEENSLFPASRATSLFHQDVYNLERQLVSKDGEYILQIREDGKTVTHLDQMSLIAIDHPGDITVGITLGGRLIGYKDEVYPVSCVDNHGKDMFHYMGPRQLGYELEDGGWLEMTFPKNSSGVVVLVPAGKPPEPYTPWDLWFGVGESPEEPIGFVYPRAIPYIAFIDTSLYDLGTQKLRISSEGETKVSNIKLLPILSIQNIAEVRTCELTSALRISGGGNNSIAEEISLEDGVGVQLSPNEIIELRFKAEEGLEDEWQRSFVLLATGVQKGMAPPDFLTGIYSTFSLRYDVVDLCIRVNRATYSDKIYGIEILGNVQQPVWDAIEALEAPEGWSVEETGNRVMFYTDTNPLLVGQPTKFRFRVRAKRISWYLRIYVTDEYHKDVGIIGSVRWGLYRSFRPV